MNVSFDGIRIRDAVLSDCRQLADWWNDGTVMAHAGFPNGIGTTPEEISNQIARESDEKGRTLMIEYRGRSIGEMNYRNSGGRIAEIGVKICESEYQNKGLGRIILSVFIKKLFSMGYGKIVLDTNLNNLRAQHIYELLGFRRIRVNHDSWTDQLGELQSSVDYELTPQFFRDRSADKLRFNNVYFITGNAYAGKSTMTKMLAEKYGGILCEENYHDRLLPGLDKTEFPCLTYTRDLKDWRDFIRRTPEEYKAWMDGVAKECEILELRILDGLSDSDRPAFVDTNISLETLRSIASHDHVLVMLADPEVSVRRFFERPDREKQFLFRLLSEEPDPVKAMENYREGLTLINSRENYDRFLNSGFSVILRDENRSAEQTMELAEKAFGLGKEPFDDGSNQLK
ncbi:MAG: GNAT family N-acetyltransferase [Clostridia bacterium]|nr:GNAT family N-acetyltransferase [Clostridia bacterium]